MITLYDYLPSQNAWKVRQLLRHLAIPHRTEIVSIFEGQGHEAAFLEINPWGAVPAIRLEDGRVLSESNAILWFLSEGTAYRPADAFGGAKVMQWLSFEIDYIQNSVGSLRYWALTGKLDGRPPSMVDGKRSTAERALAILDAELRVKPFICGGGYTIADIALFAYAHRADEAGLDTTQLSAFTDWVARVRARDGYLAETYPYSDDPYAMCELP
ncbi:glutathione S-transferase family protein [Sphingomonas sp. RT2P30]|uniref:glutathione S-transferase family protein n=1 Tax=Parasphingomonas halimpatiens TaxID=3096162 RepID=UPI002FC6BD5F